MASTGEVLPARGGTDRQRCPPPTGTVTVFEYDVLDDVLAFGFADVDGDAGAC
jgi:hypothetical protein